ncbi:M48 family metallopeptidase [Kaustia mangrovi]|uniref:M48 family metallopeptidase n=1 Tax=Kaustia mangrovi TaxID=2593653 RepID=A0A7S8HDK3_9HYPH|nr:M48 family metalloprotease [Kaustia mangrovi]QPC44745.1 M48 family metallopeptidase [Kaustia mangrovi]
MSVLTRNLRVLSRRALATGLAACLSLSALPAGTARAQNVSLIRDAETEELLRDYATPIFRAAGLAPSVVRVHILNDDRLNAFVAGGQRIFINTGMLMDAKTPNEVIGVLAHETGHIAGGHLSRMSRQLDQASTTAIIGMLLGAAAVVGGGLAGQGGVARSGQGVMLGGQSLAMRNLLSYRRAQESAADQAALKYLTATKQSAQGMITLFEELAMQSMASARYADPYVLSHPMPLERVRNLENAARKSPYFNTKDPASLVKRHKLVQAKLMGFLKSPQRVYQKYPTSDTSEPARYARAIAAFRSGDLRTALSEIDPLIRADPKNPYFWELKGQALFEAGRASQAVEPLKRAVALAPNSGLIRIMLAQALLGAGGAGNLDQAMNQLLKARRTENGMPLVHSQLAIAYARKGNIPMAELETAESAVLSGDLDLAKQKAKRAQSSFKRGSPQWIRANDILNIEPPRE